MSKHTPGPWWLTRNESPIVVRGGTDEDETHVCVLEAPWTNASALADARLIATAPELLVWLRRLREIVINEFAADPGHIEAHRMVKGYQDDVDAAGAVIAKAEE